MTDADYEVVCSKIDEEKGYLNSVSQDIWKLPELAYKEVHAHALLTCALKRHGFKVQKHYYMQTAFRAEFSTNSGTGVTVAFLLEYDALPEIGHACGHNLIAEAGLAAAIASKAAMEKDKTIIGKVVVLGTPAEEGGGGKIKLLEFGAFDGIDVALMVHPGFLTRLSPIFLSSVKGSVHFKGKEAHAGAVPWLGVNALDAAVSCYQNLALMRQQIKPTCRINVIITKGGSAANVIPDESSMEFFIRASTMGELKSLVTKVENCIKSAACATGCEMEFSFVEEDCYNNLITNKVLINLFDSYLNRLGYINDDKKAINLPVGSTDMGNVSHKIPSIHPLYRIPATAVNHTKEYTKFAGAETAQEPTLQMGKAMALTALHVLRSPEVLEEIKKEFISDLEEDSRG
ncbi:xaa-Arg dipeptidase isoform X2 [Parasteatoda tepidariorum]|uniref:xaa-Arg dipeptidase isoform X2 n=1 Tax=Parasteatoda tepidariorum TaxID=114398 RepID=UPI001C71C536|nr:peptidase M20 domain-containing protein 2 isoform X1 [Parasteatoda tepidariorum]